MTSQSAGDDCDGRLLDPLVRRWTAVGTAIALLGFALLATLGRPWRLFADQRAFTDRFFDIQAASLLHGRLSVPAGSLSFEGFVTPRGTFMYFGILPALLRLPIRLFTDSLDGRLGVLSCMVAVSIVSVCTARLARRAQLHIGLVGVGVAEPSPRWYAVIAAAPVLFSPLLYLASRSMVYHESIAWGVAGAVWGVDAAMQWWYRRAARDLAVAGLAAAVAVNSRPSVGLVPMLVLAAFAAIVAWRRQWAHAAMAAGAAAVAFGIYALVDFARFGQWWGAPSNLQGSNGIFADQAAASVMTGNTLFSLRFVPTTMAHYINPFRADLEFTRLFPFVEFGRAPKVVGDVPMQLGPSGSIVSAAPVLVLLALVGAVWIARRGDVAWRVSAAAACVTMVTTLGFWAVWHRYLADFVPLLVVLSAPGWWIALRFVSGADRWVRVALAAAVSVLLLLGVIGQVGVSLWSRFYLFPGHEVEQAEVTRLRYGIDGWFFDGVPPGVRRVSPGAIETLPSGRVGELAIVGDCDALFIDDYGWRPFELVSGDVTAFCRSLLERLPD